MKAELMKISCLTNLHVGSGDIKFEIIDGQVEKDPITNYPVIFASGVKGALREYAEQHLKNSDEVEEIFGTDRKRNNEKKGKAGSVKFLTAQLIAMPMRTSEGKQSYYMVTTKRMLLQFCKLRRDIEDKSEALLQDVMQLDNEKNYCLKREDGRSIGVEGYEAELEIPENLCVLTEFLLDTFPENVVILSERDMDNTCLPVVARNCLENGKSEHLWYEEIVPHESVFYLYMLSNETPSGDRSLEKLLALIAEKPLVQFGGNMTIGNGLTKVERWDFHE